MRFWDLFQWWNLIFTLPFGIGLLPLLLQAVGAASAHGGHAAHIGHHHLPHSGGPRLQHAHPAASPAHGSTHSPAPAVRSHAAANTQTPSQSIASRLMGFLGIGKVPIMLVLAIFSMVWGATGVVANEALSHILRAPAVYIWPSAFCALVVSYYSTHALAQRISRIIPDLETYGTDEATLVGRSARAAYDLGATPGSAFLTDDGHNRIQVRCRTHDGSIIPRGAEVLLLEYDPQSRIFTVVRMQREAVVTGQAKSVPSAAQQQKMKLQ